MANFINVNANNARAIIRGPVVFPSVLAKRPVITVIPYLVKTCSALKTKEIYEILLFIYEIYYIARPALRGPNSSDGALHPRPFHPSGFCDVFSRRPVVGLIYRSSTFY